MIDFSILNSTTLVLDVEQAPFILYSRDIYIYIYMEGYVVYIGSFNVMFINKRKRNGGKTLFIRMEKEDKDE